MSTGAAFIDMHTFLRAVEYLPIVKKSFDYRMKNKKINRSLHYDNHSICISIYQIIITKLLLLQQVVSQGRPQREGARGGICSPEINKKLRICSPFE